MSHGSYFVHNVYRDGRWVAEIDRAPQGWRIVPKDDNVEHVHEWARWSRRGTLLRRAA